MSEAKGRSMDLQQLMADVCAVHEVYLSNKRVRPDDGWYLLKLMEELGELTQVYLRKTSHSLQPGGGRELDEACAVECADVLCHVLLFAKKNGIDVIEAVERKWLSYLR